MTIIYQDGSFKQYTAQTLDVPVTLGAGVSLLTLTADRTDSSWVNAVGEIATFAFYDASGNLLGSGGFSGGVATRHGVTVTTSVFTVAPPNGAASFASGSYKARIVVEQTVTTKAVVFTTP